MIDDICDGGRTFIEMAKALKAENAARLSLYVTHGIFSQGLKVFKGLFDTIYTTDSIQNSVASVDGIALKVIDVCERL